MERLSHATVKDTPAARVFVAGTTGEASATPPIVLLPADHAASTVHVSCPVKFARLLHSTFCDTDVFCLCAQPPHVVLDNLRLAQPRWIRQALGWTFHWKRNLPYAYSLPRESEQWMKDMKARLIVSYTRTWITSLGNLLSMALNAIAQTVFTRDDILATVPSILRTAWKVMHSLRCHFDLSLEQQDIAGFYNAVPHFRTLQAVQILVARFRDLQQLADPNALLSVSLQSATRLTRAFSRNMEAASTSRQQTSHSTYCSIGSVFPATILLYSGTVCFSSSQGASVGLMGCVGAVQELLFRENYSTLLCVMLTIERFFLLILSYVLFRGKCTCLRPFTAILCLN